MICELDKEYVDLKQIDHISECFRNLCTDWNLFWNDIVHCDIQHNDHNLNFSDVDSYQVDVFIDFVPETVMQDVEIYTR